MGRSKREGRRIVRGVLVREGSAAAREAMRHWSRPCDVADSGRARSLLARALLRWLLAEMTGTPFGWRFDAETSGRPIVHRKGAGFLPSIAISHSGGWVACGLARCGQIGIDIEVYRPGRNIMGIAGLAFGAAERQEVERDGEAAFYRIWTSREALAKARGRGLAEAADGIDRVEGSSADCVQLRRIGGEAWWLAHVTPLAGLSLALALRCSRPQLATIHVLADQCGLNDTARWQDLCRDARWPRTAWEFLLGGASPELGKPSGGSAEPGNAP